MRWSDGMRHHQLNGHESEQTPGDSKGQESLACCRPWGCKEVGVTYWLSNNKAFSNWRLLSDAPSDLDGQCMRKCRQITTSQKNRLWDCMWTHGRGETANQVCLLGNTDETAYSYKCNQKKKTPQQDQDKQRSPVNLSKAFSRQGILSQIIQRLGQYTSNKWPKEGILAFVIVLSKH